MQRGVGGHSRCVLVRGGEMSRDLPGNWHSRFVGCSVWSSLARFRLGELLLLFEPNSSWLAICTGDFCFDDLFIDLLLEDRLGLAVAMPL